MVSKKCVRKAVDTIGINAEMHCYVSVVLSAQMTCSHIYHENNVPCHFLCGMSKMNYENLTVDFYCAC
jgi:hypothetical protein